jgi:hypothetical protein
LVFGWLSYPANNKHGGNIVLGVWRPFISRGCTTTKFHGIGFGIADNTVCKARRVQDKIYRQLEQDLIAFVVVEWASKF